MLDKILQWDRDTFVYLNSLGIEQYDVFWSTVTKFPPWIPLFVLIIILLFVKFPKREGISMLFTILVMAAFVATLTDLTKNVVERLRPNNDEELNTLIRILRSPSGFSFFSGHASSSFSIITLTVLFLRQKFKWVYLFYIWPILFALSRVYVGVHFPIDIIVGALVGIFSAWLFYRLYGLLILPYLKSSHPL
ncbi:phosphatase PAP2 family protein [Maribacter hydrothermalis]|uniref:Phosphatidic acid phosphatase n=1 Tax=Maribacter hydrothermalis TaxID=1836467 RepID=A0A1B7Z6A0_9FLAO|nr:phosphatase PAP2 family protein [Maribacter hydrothermalis]APQ16502.1 phosphatase PAP2 family protein [Maribacter hydrothermalis]OBR38238.1 phosphatidic acid phosphatase [Maribacter hydrothermalis]